MAQPLAVIGMACRFPGGIDTTSGFWELLKSGHDVIGDLPTDRWDLEGWHHPDPSHPGKSYATQGGFRRDVDLFDAGFFGISPREASRMDPQQRLLLEMTWEALEDAGQVPSALAGSETAVIFGASSVDYQNVQLADPGLLDAYTNPGCSPSIAANRVSYFFDFHGPSLTLDTACSSSLTALDLACEAVRSGRAPLAIVGGINLLLAPSPWVGFSKAQMLSRSGRCRVFDADADGYVRSEGGGVLVIKPLDRARAARDPIRAVILASALNSDGRTHGLLLPSARAQEALLREVYARAGVEPSRVAYVEAHGTGTPVGDPIECQALGAALGSRRREPLYVGSVKTNLGHLEAAAGIAGVMKVILALQHRELPRSLHFATPNRQIPFAQENLAVVTDTVSLADSAAPLVMGVNSFGFGGSNAHVVLEEYREPPAASTDSRTALPRPLPLFLSAHLPAALRDAAANYARYLADQDGPPLYDVCRTAALHRQLHAHRLAVFGANREEFASRLSAFAAERESEGVVCEKVLAGADQPVFVFSGNGSQWPGMGRELMRESPVFRDAVERVDREFEPLAGWSVSAALLDPALDSRLARTEIAQPLLFAVQVGLVELLASYGLKPRAAAGHSVGEVAAAWASGIYSLAQAARVIQARSQAQARAAGRGRMAACGLSLEQAGAILASFSGALEVASINSPSSVTISGDALAIEDLRAHLEPQGIFFRLLDLDYPFHSRLVDDVRLPLLQALDGLRPNASQIPFVSCTTGAALGGVEMDAEYWWHNVRRPVLFEPALAQLIRGGHSLFIEIGPHPVLSTYIRQCLESAASEGRAIQTLRRDQPEFGRVLSAIGLCYAAGANLDLPAIFPEPARPVSLPAYPWRKERHWSGAAIGHPSFPGGVRQHPLLGYRSATADFTWDNEIDIARLPYLADHPVLGAIVFPAAALLEMALKAARLFRGAATAEVEDFELRGPLALQENRSTRIRLSIRPDDGTFRIEARAGDAAAWTLAATGRLAVPACGHRPATVPFDELRTGLTVPMTTAGLYQDFANRGLRFGPAFRLLQEIWAKPGEAVGRYAADAACHADYCFYPPVLDASLQLISALNVGAYEPGVLYLPAGFRRFRLYAEGRDAAFSQVRLVRYASRSLVADIRVFDAEGGVVAEIDGFRIQRVETAAGRSASLPLLEVRAVLEPGLADRDDSPPVLPAPACVAQAVRATNSPARAWIDEVCGLFAWEALVELGAVDGPFLRLPPERVPLLDRLVEFAVQDGFLRAEGGRWAITGKQPARTAAEAWRRGVAEFPAYLAESQMLAHYGMALPRVLRGESVAPPDAALEHFNDWSPSARTANSVVRAVMAEVIRDWPRDRVLRVLEIRGDVGPLAPHILPLLPAECGQYRLAHSVDDGFQERGFDVVIGAGCPAETLQRAREFIRPGGLFVLIVRAPQRLVELCYPATRFAGREEWIALLRESGFEIGEVVGAVESDVILARNPPAQSPQTASPAAPSNVRTWLVLRDDDDLLLHLTTQLTAAGHRVIHVMPGPAYERRTSDLILAPRHDPEASRRMFQDLASEGVHCDEVIHGWGLTRETPENAAALAELTGQRCLSALSLAQGIALAELAAPPRLWLLTRGAMPVSPAVGEVHPAQAPLWGLGRVLANENPRLVTKLVDLHWDTDAPSLLNRLMIEFAEPGAEDEIVLTERARYVHRVSLGDTAAAKQPPKPGTGFHVVLTRPGSLDHLVLEQCARPAPDPGQVEIRVRAAGLNFRDVMLSLGLLPEEAVETGFAGSSLGVECAGEVARIGEGVTGLRPGDAVAAFARHCFSKYILAEASHVLPIPNGAGYEAAATMLTASATAIYALEHLGRIEPGERLLIHGAAGGVGLAAIQYAAHVGAEVFATAGTEDKREYLRLLGVPHVFSSRTPDYAGQIMEATHGQGVDLVLNSLAGEDVARSFSLLRPFGRFLELGKRDFVERNRMAMAPFRNNLSYFGIDLDQALAARPTLRDAILSRLLELTPQGVLRPLPYRVFPVSRVREAFRHMQSSRHIGKIVISFDDGDVRVAPGEGSAPALRPDGTYLVTGGFSGLGLETARWMARRGARHLALVSRGGPASPEAAAALEELRAAGVEVLVGRADVADEAALSRVLAEISAQMPPLRGIVHAAMVLDDALVPSMTPDRFWHAARPKILGAWNLHRLTLDAPLDFFVLYSSVAALLGNPGQTNYAAGNLFLESLAHYRNSLGRCATAISWGAISDTGYLARNPAIRDKIESRLAMRPLSSQQALRYLDRILARNCPHWTAADVNWPELASTFPALMRSAKFASLVKDGTSTAGAGAAEDVLPLLRGLPPAEVRAVVTEILVKELARVLRGTAGRVDAARPLADLGLDSLMAVELLTVVENRFHVQITPLEIMGGVTLSQVAARIADSVLSEREAAQ